MLIGITEVVGARGDLRRHRQPVPALRRVSPTVVVLTD
jgi:hypothetical protein